MAKTSYRWKQFLWLVFSQTKSDWDVLALSSRQVSRLLRKSLILLALVSFWWWNGQLLMATAVGISLMWLTYKVSRQPNRQLWQKFTHLLTGYNQRLLLAVGTGSLGGLATYMVAAIWADTESHWLATGSILQGLGTLTTLIVLSWHINRQSQQSHEIKFERLLQDLTASDALKRFIAIRQLTNLARQKVIDREHRWQLVEYFYFMLAQSPEPSIQDALLDSLTVLGFSPVTVARSSEVSIPIKLESSIVKQFKTVE